MFLCTGNPPDFARNDVHISFYEDKEANLVVNDFFSFVIDDGSLESAFQFWSLVAAFQFIIQFFW